jgi:cellulose synthase/poly-beta-1,6-N-acetylglucosamine synthase-like glycosyltransferase
LTGRQRWLRGALLAFDDNGNLNSLSGKLWTGRDRQCWVRIFWNGGTTSQMKCHDWIQLVLAFAFLLLLFFFFFLFLFVFFFFVAPVFVLILLFVLALASLILLLVALLLLTTRFLLLTTRFGVVLRFLLILRF